jgi:hypothetical protein
MNVEEIIEASLVSFFGAFFFKKEKKLKFNF